jgi:hypothetical protein
MTIDRAGGRAGFGASADLAIWEVGTRDGFGCGRREGCGLRTDLVALRFIDRKFLEARIAERG